MANTRTDKNTWIQDYEDPLYVDVYDAFKAYAEDISDPSAKKELLEIFGSNVTDLTDKKVRKDVYKKIQEKMEGVIANIDKELKQIKDQKIIDKKVENRVDVLLDTKAMIVAALQRIQDFSNFAKQSSSKDRLKYLKTLVRKSPYCDPDGYYLSIRSEDDFNHLAADLKIKPYLLKTKDNKYKLWRFRYGEWKMEEINFKIPKGWDINKNVFVTYKEKISGELRHTHFLEEITEIKNKFKIKQYEKSEIELACQELSKKLTFALKDHFHFLYKKEWVADTQSVNKETWEEFKRSVYESVSESINEYHHKTPHLRQFHNPNDDLTEIENEIDNINV